ncbi:LuxR family transcriptional regulator [Actinotalea ferrariae CF5-4]|uniref:LuxR family transcriptional regulator n=1 Tax=Actinotalea ferrariae CF5-4 TaxID=948458 RepID=A0A021VUB6_9CELL|nr:response regulator transcription factor [Actinotalea ferrariae]EYR63640.1 LuxR family transcriptional regulator [Actinotalea ferrariae CF5-4]
MTSVLLVDDDPFVRKALTTILAPQGLEVVGAVQDGDQVVRAVRELRPDVVLMDLGMARIGGVAATAAVRALDDPPAVCVLTAFETRDDMVGALRAGATGFLHKDAEPDEIAAAVRDVAAGGGAFAPRVARLLAEHVAADPYAVDRAEADARLAVLSDRELDVARAVAVGSSNQEIAQSIFVSEGTVKTLLNRALAKLDLRNRTELAVLVARAGRL